MERQKALEVFVEGVYLFHSELLVEELGEHLCLRTLGGDYIRSTHSKFAERIFEEDPPVDGFATGLYDINYSELFKRDLSLLIGAIEMQKRPSRKYEITFLMQPGVPGIGPSEIGLYILCQRLMGEPGITYSLKINDRDHDETHPITVKEIK